jgi:hypothetical protein
VAGDLRGIHAALQAGADVNHEQRSGPPAERFTPLMAACYRGHVQVGGREQPLRVQRCPMPHRCHLSASTLQTIDQTEGLCGFDQVRA